MTDPGSRSTGSWRDRYDAARAQGVPLDPSSEPVKGVDAYPTSYDRSHLLITVSDGELDDRLALLRDAGSDFGWGIQLQNMDGSELTPEDASARAQRWREAMDLPIIHRVEIFPQPSPDKDDQPVPPIDAWRLLQRARARAAARGDGPAVPGVSLDHVMTVDPFGGGTNPFGGGTNPFGGGTNPFGGGTNPFGGRTNDLGMVGYAVPGTGGRQVVDYAGAGPQRSAVLSAGGRRPVVAILDTGCGSHEWLPDDIVTRYPVVDGRVVGDADPSTDPEVFPDQAGPYDGMLDPASGHGTFIAGIIRQLAPEADIVAVRVANSMGALLEGDFMMAVRSLVKWMMTPEPAGGRLIDVINLSLGYYHETPDDDLFDRTLAEMLLVARRNGCAVVCSAGNDATDRPAFPAALWNWTGADFYVDDSVDAAPHTAVGALNPAHRSVALFSNIGGWVKVYAPGVSVLSITPGFVGGTQALTRNDREGLRRESLDPDDFRGGYAVWSGTSFAAPYIAGSMARSITDPLMRGQANLASERIANLRAAEGAVIADWDIAEIASM
ncbi:S8 family peptidase [Microbacterium sp. ASV49]|uniref:S8 family serine peptidase n=1 Tax=Microbacterium candidum TaxID=3041922 RepID=A0ABT7MVP6_9MICO|nr:S8 family serine peptidase [Microbacterium sp. ASV49]MDL9978511.1 S8 family serine peptidase [Microbacterium sp. ASV49]